MADHDTEQNTSLVDRFNDKIITLQMRDETITVQLQRRDTGHIETEENVHFETEELGATFGDAAHFQLQPEYVAIVSSSNPDRQMMVQRLDDIENTLRNMRSGNDTGEMSPEMKLHLDIKSALVEANDELVKSGEVDPNKPLVQTLEAGPWT